MDRLRRNELGQLWSILHTAKKIKEKQEEQSSLLTCTRHKPVCPFGFVTENAALKAKSEQTNNTKSEIIYVRQIKVCNYVKGDLFFT